MTERVKSELIVSGKVKTVFLEARVSIVGVKTCSFFFLFLTVMKPDNIDIIKLKLPANRSAPFRMRD